jgi:hypothetical protein
VDFRKLIFVFFFWCISASAFAAQISGTATNGTTGKPSSGDEVVLLSLAGGMDEVGHTRTDAQGRFAINVPDDGVQHLVRVAHQGVNYYRTVPPGTTTVEINIYDAAAEVANIIQESRVFRVHKSELEDWAQFGKVRAAYEKKLKDPDDVLLEAEERKKELGKNRKRKSLAK